MRRTLVGLCCVAVAAAAALPVVGSTTAAAAGMVAKQGYIRMADGARLEYTVDLPSAHGRFPVAMVYDGYSEGVGPLACNDVASAQGLLAAGFAVIGVSIRGTSCSTGLFDAFTPQEWRDGAAAVEWAARQPWSNGHVGMFGDSFPGITQLGVAGLRPPHLDAIAPFQVTSDIYRDVAYPGGLLNVGFGAFWAGVDQPLNSYESGLEQAVTTTNVACIASLAANAVAEPTNNVALQALGHPFDGTFWHEHEPGAKAAKIHIPTFGCYTWQDDEVSSRASSFYAGLNPKRTWVVATNGYHGQCELSSPRVTDELVGFFDRFVKGAHNGFARRTPHIQVWHDTTVKAGKNTPSWVTHYSSYQAMPVRPLALYFRSDGALALTPPKGGQPDRYVYPGPSLGDEDGVVLGQHGLLWKGGEPRGAALSYTSPRLTRDTEFFGSGSANIWLSSTAPDTDLQITLTDVRPDGQEVYIGRGWLRASRRALNHKRSTRLAPFQTQQQPDVRFLTPGRPTRMRVQLYPFDHVFRKGSRIRLWIDAPTGFTGGWSLNFLEIPGINSVYADAQHPSALVLGHLRGGHAKAPRPACGTLLNEPCRQNAGPLPPGKMTIR